MLIVLVVVVDAAAAVEVAILTQRTVHTKINRQMTINFMPVSVSFAIEF